MTNPTTRATVDAEHPWPGLLAFSEDARAYFHGREAETAELSNLIEREPLTVLFGQSGLGKSSLLNAGVFPCLRRAGYLPLYLRLNLDANAPALIEQVWQILNNECASHDVSITAPQAGDSFWKYLHRPDTVLKNPHGRAVTPVLVFDQFEELFTLGRQTAQQAARCQAFLVELGELIENRLPASLEAELTKNPEALDEFDLFRQNLKTVFAFREDYLADFEGLKTLIRPIMQNRMRLTPMLGTRAAQAIKLAGQEKVSPAVADRVVRFVGGAGLDETVRLDELQVEPALLSLVCRELNAQRLQRGEAEISADLIQGGNTHQIIERFYLEGFAGLKLPVKHFVEDRLLTKVGYRDSVSLDNALAEPGVTAEAIQALVDRRILRREERAGRVRLELIHDVLTVVAKASRDQRWAEQAMLETQRQLAEQKKRQRLFAMAVVVLLLVFVGVSWMAFEASRARNVAEQQRLAAVNASQAAQQALATADAQRLLAEAAEKRAVQGKQEAELQRQATDSQRVIAEAARAEGEKTLGLALAEKADRSFAENRSNEGQLFAAHALARLPLNGDEKVAAAIARLRGHRIAFPGVKTFIVRDTKDETHRVAFSPDGALMAEATTGPIVRLWNLQTRKMIGTFDSGSEGVWNLAFSPDARILATSSRDKAIRLFDVAQPKLLHVLNGHEQFVSHVVFSMDSRKIASWSPDRSVRIWDVASGQSLQVLKWNQLEPHGAMFSPDGARLLSWSLSAATQNDAGPKLLDVASGRLIATLSGHQGARTTVRFSPDGRMIASVATGDREFKLWSGEDGRRIGELTTPKWQAAQTSFSSMPTLSTLAFSPDGQTLATVIADRTIRLWNIPSRALTTTLHGLRSPAIHLRFSDDGHTVSAISPVDSVIRRWDAVTGSTLPAINALGMGMTGNMGMTADLRQVGIAARPDGGVMVAQQAGGPSMTSATGSPVLAAWWGNTGRPLVLLRASDQSSAVVRDAEGGPDLAVIPENTRRLPAGAFSPDGQIVAMGAADNAVRLWDTKTAKLLATLKGHTDEVQAICFSPDGRMLATVSTDKTVRLWDAASAALLATLEGHTAIIYGLAFAPDGRTVASGASDHSVRLWDVARKTQIGVLTGHSGTVSALAFSPDGRTLASGASDNTMRLWNMSDRSLRATRQNGENTALKFSPDGRFLLSNGRDPSEAFLWDLGSTKLAKVFEIGGFYSHFVFSPDGTAILAGTERTGVVTILRDFKREDGITDWRVQATKDEARYGMKLDGIRLVPK